jgi:hypothetical protein
LRRFGALHTGLPLRSTPEFFLEEMFLLEMGFWAARSRLYGRAVMIAGLEAEDAATPFNF